MEQLASNDAGAAGAANPEGELLQQLRAGQGKAFERLMRAHNRLLFRAARGIVPDDAEAQDVVQETWLRAFLALDGFRGESSLSTWLMRIAINQALGQQRKLGRLVFWNEDAAGEADEMPSGNGEQPMRADHQTPEQQAARNQLRRSIEQAVDLLPPIYRCVFLLRAVQGLSVEDTAAALEVSQDVVKTRYLRARAQLRARLDGISEADLCLAHDFQGARCDETIRVVLAALREAGVVRDH